MARTVTTNDLLDALRTYSSELPKSPPGKGWSTLVELAKTEGVHPDTMHQRIKRAERNGLSVERFIGSAVTNGRVRKQMWYRLKA